MILAFIAFNSFVTLRIDFSNLHRHLFMPVSNYMSNYLELSFDIGSSSSLITSVKRGWMESAKCGQAEESFAQHGRSHLKLVNTVIEL